MKVLVVGGGGREHALAWKVSKSQLVTQVFCAPGNAGTAGENKVRNVDIAASDVDSIVTFAQNNSVDLTVVGPEQPLVAGVVDRLRASGMLAFGPTQAAAKLEGSKLFAKQLMRAAAVPTADYYSFDDIASAKTHLKSCTYPQVLKLDGLAAGKGVAVCQSEEQALSFLDSVGVKPELAEAAGKILIESFIAGRELSLIALCAGSECKLMQPARDYKRLLEGNGGPNTGGMGAYTPVDDADAHLLQKVEESVFQPVLRELQSRDTPFFGALYAGLMIADNTPYVLEFNVRFGDPETQPLLFHLESDIVPEFVAISEGKLLNTPLTWRPGASMCVVVSSEGYPGSYAKGIEVKLDATLEDDAFKVFHAGTKLGDNGKVVTSGGRVLGVTQHAANLKAARTELYEKLPSLAFAGSYYRRDIGISETG